MKLTICTFVLCIALFKSQAQSINIIPQPAEMTIGKGNFTISSSTALIVKNGVDNNTADFLNDYLKQYFGFKLKKLKSAQSNYIQFSTLQTLVPGQEGAYALKVSAKSIIIQGQTASGTFCGMQTLIQLLPSIRTSSKFPVPVVTINDAPRFQYRGMHLDCGRHFFSVSFVKRYIDYLALHKFNRFHWHLTEDQGWRIEIKKYPRLTQVGAWRNGTIVGRNRTSNDGGNPEEKPAD
jgi:hexosaminidase